MTPISPLPQPHGYASQWNFDDQQLPHHLSDLLKTVKGRLDQIATEAKQKTLNTDQLIEDITNLDADLSHFFSELAKDSNRAFAKHMKDKVEGIFHRLTQELDEIKTLDESSSLSDVLYDSNKLRQFLETLGHSSQGREALAHLSAHCYSFAKELSATFHLL